MKFSGLKVISACILSVFVMSCNDESANNSSTGTSSDTVTTSGSVTGDNTSADLPDTSTGQKSTSAPVARKKKGSASAKLAMENEASVKMEKDKEGYYVRTEVAPMYKGGQASLENYITNNIEYPQQAIDNSTEGTVMVQFAVDENGNISNVKTIGNKIGYGLEEEAVRVVSKMPKWIPGVVSGKNVKAWRTLPITYRFEDI
jgi:TonB family protein